MLSVEGIVAAEVRGVAKGNEVVALPKLYVVVFAMFVVSCMLVPLHFSLLRLRPVSSWVR